jgi:hypothetical protein
MAAFRIFAIVLVAKTLLSAFADAQGLGKKGSGGRSEYPVEDHPKVDEKAYKAALDRIPEPDKKYDPWGCRAPIRASECLEKIEPRRGPVAGPQGGARDSCATGGSGSHRQETVEAADRRSGPKNWSGRSPVRRADPLT